MKTYSIAKGTWIKLASFLPPFSRDASCLIGGSIFSNSKGGLTYILDAEYPHELEFDWKNATSLFSSRKTKNSVEQFAVHHHKFKLFTQVGVCEKSKLDLQVSLVYQGLSGPYVAAPDALRDLKAARVPRLLSSEFQPQKDPLSLPIGAQFHQIGPHGSPGQSGYHGTSGTSSGNHGRNGEDGSRGEDGKTQHVYDFTVSGQIFAVCMTGGIKLTVDGKLIKQIF